MKISIRTFVSIGLGLSVSMAFPQTDCTVLVPEISLIYKGECKNGLAHGNGEASGRDHYTGEFKKGYPHGAGSYEWSSGEVYEGHWKKGMRHGQGEYVFFVEGKDSVLAGKWVNDEYVGIQYRESAYSIEYRNNIGRVTFNRMGTTPYIRLKFVRGGGDINISSLVMDGSSGSQTFTRMFTGFEQVEFPFRGKIQFSAPNAWGAESMNCELRFEIKEPGSWIVAISL